MQKGLSTISKSHICEVNWKILKLFRRRPKNLNVTFPGCRFVLIVTNFDEINMWATCQQCMNIKANVHKRCYFVSSFWQPESFRKHNRRLLLLIRSQRLFSLLFRAVLVFSTAGILNFPVTSAVCHDADLNKIRCLFVESIRSPVVDVWAFRCASPWGRGWTDWWVIAAERLWCWMWTWWEERSQTIIHLFHLPHVPSSSSSSCCLHGRILLSGPSPTTSPSVPLLPPCLQLLPSSHRPPSSRSLTCEPPPPHDPLRPPFLFSLFSPCFHLCSICFSTLPSALLSTYHQQNFCSFSERRLRLSSGTRFQICIPLGSSAHWFDFIVSPRPHFLNSAVIWMKKNI